jgi:DNA-binding NarL/FixJ family response regulator
VGQSNVTTRVLLADHHALVRAGVRCLLQEIGGVEVVAEANDGREAVNLVARHRPQLVLMEIGMPHLNGVEATRQIVSQFPLVRVLILSMHTSEEHVLQALRAGASGYVHKGSLPTELLLAIESVARGEIFLSPAISRQVIEAYLTGATEQGSSLEELTPRQREILQLIAEGHSSKEIARILNASAKTIECHRTNIMDRLAIRNISGLVRYAVRHGLVSDR